MIYKNNNNILLVMGKLRDKSTCLWGKLMRSVVGVLNFGCQLGPPDGGVRKAHWNEGQRERNEPQGTH